MIVNERITAYINSLTKELPDYLYDLEKRALEEGVPIIRKETQSLLRFLVCSNQPDKILEVGTAVGFSALLMSECMPADCLITTIEKVEMRLAKAKENISKAPHGSKIKILEGDALEILKDLADKGESYPFIFMDAAKGQYMNFLPHILKMMPKGSLLITDNVLQDGAVAQSRFGVTRRDRTIHTRMREYLYTLTHTEGLETAIIPIGDGITVSTKLV